MRISRLLVLLVLFGFSGVSNAQDMGLDKDFPDSLGKLLDLDAKFSALSAEKGTVVAFSTYLADSAIAAQDRGGFLHGLPAIIDDMGTDGTGTLTWKPLGGSLPEGSSLGYTYGRWTYEGQDFEGNPTSEHGKYVSIWRKQYDGTWKIIFDMGNGNEAPSDNPLN